MKQAFPYMSRLASLRTFLFLFLILFAGCQRLLDELHPHKDPNARDFRQVNLLASNDEYQAKRIDSRLVNAWGIAFNPNGIAWVNATGTGLSFVLDKDGNQLREPVKVPPVPSGPPTGLPTGIVFNGSTTAFKLPNGNPARFIFAGVDGAISGWNGGDEAVIVVNNSSTSAYTGLAIARSEGHDFLYAANFRAGTIDVFDAGFKKVTNMPFHDPYLPSGYAPFNIQAIGDLLFVLYAKVGPNGRDVPGLGNGYVNVFNTAGYLVQHFASRGALNAPWGVAQAPEGFFGEELKRNEDFRKAILVGNFGDGRINIYSTHGKFLGQLRDKNKEVIEIDGLWALTVPPSSIDQRRLYFAAGPDEEEHGLFGYLIKE